MSKIGISLEASSWRGAYAAGVLEAFGRRGIYPDIVSGSSAGACNGAAYVARDFDILTGNWIDLASERMIDLRRESRRANGGSIFNMSRIFNTALDRGLSAGTLGRLASSPVELLVACTRIAGEHAGSDYWNDRFLVHYPLASRLARLAGQAPPPPPFELEIFSSRDPVMKRHAREVLYASGRIPILYSVRARVGDASYIDGGFLEKNPIEALFDRGCERVLAIVTNPTGTVHRSFFDMGESAYVKAARRDGRVLVLHPEKDLGVSKYYWNVERVKRAVRLGQAAGEDFLLRQGDRFFR